jgi:hypothetical protein
MRFVPVRNSLSADDLEIVFGAGIAICGAARRIAADIVGSPQLCRFAGCLPVALV